MHMIHIYSHSDIQQLVRHRKGETKLGEEVSCITNKADLGAELQQNNSKYVLVGIPEDIGVRANYGRGGAHTAWKPALESFLNQQSNSFLNGKSICVLGHIEVEDLMEKASSLTLKNATAIQELRVLVDEIDRRVEHSIKQIISIGKIPIIIGGGHNNSYPIIKASSIALNTSINVINCDPHTDFRALEGRHSGNGFSYAYQEKYLNQYSVFAMHEQYNTQEVLNYFTKENTKLYYSSYESIFVREQLSFSDALKQNISFVKQQPCGVEIDLDAITNVPSSAKTSSGISPIQARQYAYQTGNRLPVLYFHIAEGAPILSHIKADNKTGKLIAYLISDFIKGVEEK